MFHFQYDAYLLRSPCDVLVTLLMIRNLHDLLVTFSQMLKCQSSVAKTLSLIPAAQTSLWTLQYAPAVHHHRPCHDRRTVRLPAARHQRLYSGPFSVRADETSYALHSDPHYPHDWAEVEWMDCWPI